MTSINFKEEGLCVKAYDTQTKELIDTYCSYKGAGKVLQVRDRLIADRCKSKKKIFSPGLKREVALRLTKI